MTSFWLRFVTKRDFDCEQVEQRTSQTELKHVSVVRLSEITPWEALKQTPHRSQRSWVNLMRWWPSFISRRPETEQESPAIADKPARRESLPKIAPIRRAYNVVADDTGLSSFV